MTHYAERDIENLDKVGGYYIRHVNALTAEGLHAKWAIAAELGHRDKTIDDLRVVIAQLTSIICNGALTPPTGDGSIVEYCEQAMNQLLAANIAYRGVLESARWAAPFVRELLDETPEAILSRLSAQIRQQHQQLLGEMAARVNHLTQLVHTAQKDYIERHSDGETDCVTPYDTYDQPGIECIHALQASALEKVEILLSSEPTQLHDNPGMGYSDTVEDRTALAYKNSILFRLKQYTASVRAGKVGVK